MHAVRKLLLLTFVSVLSALSIDAKTKMGIAPEAGFSLSNISFSDGTTGWLKAGFKAGINFDKFISDQFSIQAGAFYSQVGSVMDINQVFVGPVKVPISLSYAQVPINLLYRMTLGKGKIIFSAGPYFGYALNMSGKPADTALKLTDFKLGTDTGSFIKQLDIGVNAYVGYQLANGFFVKLGYATSLTNISAQNGQTLRNSIWSISVGWFYRSTKVKIENKAYSE
jgi:hypothetical protein